MSDIPFRIPESLATYLVQFESSPKKTIGRLKKQLKKRGPDPVAYFILGWLHYREGSTEEAITCALKAKTFAPGSPFFDKLHYFFTHPELFDAWRLVPDGNAAKDMQYRYPEAGPILDLDSLIQKLSSVDARKINRDETAPSNQGSTLSPDSDEVDDIVSETLARIHEQQGKLKAAIETYTKLKRLRPEKEDAYNRRIEELKKQRADGNDG